MPTTTPRRLVFVDDDERVVQGLAKSLRVYRRQWDASFATSMRQAVELLESGSFDAIVTDARMPHGDGEALLRVVQARWPQMVRVVLTGEVTLDVSRRLCHLAHQFLTKPATSQTIFERVEESLRWRERLASDELRTLVCQLGTLPAVPITYAKLNELSAQEDATIDALAQVVEADAAVAASALRLVNSAHFGLSRSISTVREAVRLLGVRPLLHTVLAVEVFPAKSPAVAALQSKAMDRSRVLAKLVAALGLDELKERATTAAVLSDVGQLALLQARPKEVAAIDDAVARGESRPAAERRLIGATHDEIGAVLLGLWSVPQEICAAVAAHHDFGVGRAVLERLVALATAVHEGVPDAWIRPLVASLGAADVVARLDSQLAEVA